MVGQAEALMYNCLQLENITKGFMDGPTDRQTDTASYRGALSHLKTAQLSEIFVTYRPMYWSTD